MCVYDIKVAHNKTASARGDACSSAKVMTANCSHSGTRGSSYAAFCRRRADLTLGIVKSATLPFKQRSMPARRVKCARDSSKSSVYADAQDLPHVRMLGRPVIASDRSALCCLSCASAIHRGLDPCIQCAQTAQSHTWPQNAACEAASL